jgi:acetyl-CoA carboxylase biotin carboxyl carrier protein
MEQNELQTYIKIFENSSLSELEISTKDMTIRMKRPVAGEAVVHPTPMLVKDSESKQTLPSDHRIITSPIVGTFYRTPSPDSPPYVEVGSVVEKGDVVCTLEAMKLMNQLEAEYKCEILAILADQGSMVEFGQPLFEVKPL